MKKTLVSIAVGSLFLTTTGCQESSEGNHSVAAAHHIAPEEVVAVVNGQEISRQALNFVRAEASQRSRGAEIPREQLVNELVTRELLAQKAEEENLESRPDIAAQMQAMKTTLLAQAMVQDFIQKDEVTDEELKVEYDARIGNMGDKIEYKARHILLKTEDEAKEVIAKLDDGGDFASLAEEFSTGPTGKTGGDLGWFAPDQMVGPFSDAVAKLENGAYTSEPVMTQFGYHVILREDSREKSAPEFDMVKPQLVPLVQRQHLQAYLQKMRQDADVEIKPEPVAPEEEVVEEIDVEVIEEADDQSDTE